MVAAALAGPLSIAPAWAEAPGACDVPAELTAFAHPRVAAAGAVLVPGQAVRVTLVRDAALPVAPEKAPPAGSHGGTFALTVAKAGPYRVVLDGPIWVDVVRDGRRLAPVGHGHAPPCSGARKLVAYDLASGRYAVQLSGGAGTAATVMIVSGGIAG